MRRRVPLLLLLAAPAFAAGCGGSSNTAASHGPIQVVAAENFWGSIAAQLGGSKAHVTSVITSPATDPHDYEPTAADGRVLAGARLAIVNGIGYDPWAGKLLSSNPVGGRIVLDVGDLVGIAAGGNPHRWYSPADVQRVIDAIAGDYAKLDPRDAAYFHARRAAFETKGLARYTRLIATIKRRYHGVPVGASESIFAPLAKALGLKLLTPGSFLKAISEGAEPTASDITTIDRQISRRQIKVWVFNSQNSTPDVQRITDAAHEHGIPVTTITETMKPASGRFQDWQSMELEALLRALAAGTGS
ncbi:MAG TPA: zinc ABC transporter substrate-binding protein [Gaiellaceae bacterium]|nr:zinc ABC transporter substrate-binding protein [Gaiellaceae bacterium]